MQKVQQLDVLDKDIEKYRAEFVKAANTAPKCSDIPAQVVAYVDRIMAMARENRTGVFKASQILEYIFDAFAYGEFASRDTFDLSRLCVRTLMEHDEMLKRVVGERYRANMENAEKLMEDCFTKLALAYKEAEDDLERQRLRAEKDHAKLSEEALQELAKQAVEIIATEKEELTSIEAHCTQDIASIEEGLCQLQQHMDRARVDYTREEKNKLEELERNKKRQRELEEELRMLKARENQLKDEVAEGKELQHKVDEALACSRENIHEWKESIAELQNKTITSLKIMNLMSECTQAIMTDALMRKQLGMKKLNKLKVDALLALRDVVLATSIEHMAGVDDCKMNLDQIKSSVQQKEAEKMKAAQTGFARKVNDLTRDLEDYNKDRLMYEKKRDMHSRELETFIAKLESIDNEIAALCPQLVLDSPQGRFTRFKQAKDQAFVKLGGVLDYSSVSH